MRSRRKIYSAVALVLVALGVHECMHWFRVDSCLDRGSRWDHQLGECDANN